MTKTQRQRIERQRDVLRLAIVSMALMLLLGLFCWANYYEHHYEREAVVTEIAEDNEVTFIDSLGYEWKAVANNVAIGQKVILIMNDECTVMDILDDSIVKIKPTKISL